jgi:hypothetical protein
MTQEKKIMSKNPYEVRLSLLEMAQSILMEQTTNERIRLENDWSLGREKASIAISNGEQNVTLLPFPIIPRVEADDIIRMAEKLNGFVSKND